MIAFKDLERAGWTAKAAAYDTWFGEITEQAYPRLLNLLGQDLTGQSLLDVCCGTGRLTAQIAGRGARAIGLDFAPAMIASAEGRGSDAAFIEADAESLPFPDKSFDQVVCSFGLLHLSNPDRAIAEAWRVLRPGGRYLATVWNGPDRGSVFFRIFFDAILSHGTMDLDLPSAPPIFRFADPAEAGRVLEREGFRRVRTETVQSVWEPASGRDVPTLVRKSLVRAAMLLDHQTPAARAAIEAELVRKAEITRQGDRLNLPFPALLITAEKPR